MTVTEFSNEFDILYDSIADKSGPGLDLYEKSVFLTKAQLEIVKTKYSIGNKYGESFESSEKRRVDLKELITHYTTSTILDNEDGISTISNFFKLPSDLFIPIQESINIEVGGSIKNISLIPKTHDEYKIQINNPFKRPDETVAWRLDISKYLDISRVEVISEYPIKNYNLRYLKIPNPIILEDLSSGEFEGQGLNIGNQTSSQTSQLHDSIHYEILDRAVELAVKSYKPSKLQMEVQTNNRNE